MTRYLAAASGGAINLGHQAAGSRLLNVLGNVLEQLQLSPGKALQMATRLGFDASSTADPLKSMLLSSLLRARILRDVKVIHVVRDPRAFVTSFMSWKNERLRRMLLHHVIPAWQPNPWLAGECSAQEWARMTKFEHFCWIWSYKNRLFDELETLCDYRRYRLEDLTAATQQGVAIADMAGFLEFPLRSNVFDGDAKVNRSDASFPEWHAWSLDLAQKLDRHCGPLMGEYGYGVEPEWRCMVEGKTRGQPSS